MIRNSTFAIVSATALLLPALTGCVAMHKSDPAPIPLLANAPSLLTPPVTPITLVTADMEVPVPEMPAPPLPSAQPTPPPASAIVDTSHRRNRRRARKADVELAEREAHERELRDKEADKPAAPPAEPTQTAQNQPTKVTATTPTGDLAQPTSIGQLTAGPAQDTSASRQQAAHLINATEQGVNTLKNLNTDQNKTVIQIRSFLDQAERALHNGDVDGASTLATKAKTLLDELTGAS